VRPPGGVLRETNQEWLSVRCDDHAGGAVPVNVSVVELSKAASYVTVATFLREHPDWGDEPADFFPAVGRDVGRY
jgi:hypothetical protein